MFKQPNNQLIGRGLDSHDPHARVVDDVVDIEDSFSKQALTGVLSPVSDEITANMMRMEEQRAKT